ncbi:HET-domain-containing protein [Plenodomus tracheiphilus IPT5]|uniref:HET-domain-containing protein n=1 Tax=Plenodomus tracheiphilus IPT5 TaxID=1408161 RepID=A0A6A7BPR5_9PLEO|nr:HET-domain-containing protein [Plenodomus tracheiphilus IPT5]
MPAICPRCTGILLDDENFYGLQSLGYMVSSECPGCDFFLEVAKRHGIDETVESQTQILLRRRSENRNLVDVYYVRRNSSNLSITLKHQLRLCAAFGFEIPFWADFEGLDDRYLGRRIAARSDGAECLDLAKSWFERCTRSHGAACVLSSDVALPTRLVHIPCDDLSQLKLCLTRGMRGRYVALSYTWGEGNSFKTTSDSIDTLRSGFRTAELPKTLRDAIAIVHKMGFEWIWIDQLCILQDSLDDWSREASCMAQVYSQSAFTICADSTSSTDESIFQERAVLQSHCFGPDSAMCLQTLCRPWGDMTIHPLYRRGWAFQERILSARNLHFLQSQVAWECNTTLYLEEGRGRQTNPAEHFAKHMFTKFYHQQRDDGTNPTEIDIIRRIGAWNAVLQEMAVRDLTYRSDKLPAISGLASALQTHEMGEYLAGVWSYNPFLSMAWFPRFSQDPSEIYRSPSWSCAWVARQIVWYYDTWRGGEDMPSSECMSDWGLWDDRHGPRLIHHKILHKDLDPKGEVLEGSSLTIIGHCRPIFVAHLPDSNFDRNFGEVAGSIGGINNPGHRICMDKRIRDYEPACSFAADLPDIDQEYNRDNVREYLSVQIVRERKERWQRPKIIGLVLERVEGSTDEAFRRVGLTDFDDVVEGEWVRKTLKLL